MYICVGINDEQCKSHIHGCMELNDVEQVAKAFPEQEDRKKPSQKVESIMLTSNGRYF